jgi:hypothetical protein
MPRTDDRTPTFLDAARAFYGPAFEHRRPKDLAAAMREWSELDPAERAFASAHLAYLNLRAQADMLRALHELRDLLDEVADGVDLALDPLDVDPLPPEPGDDDVLDAAPHEDPNPDLVGVVALHEDPNPGHVDPASVNEDPNPDLVGTVALHEDPNPDLVDALATNSAPDRFRVDVGAPTSDDPGVAPVEGA